MLLWSQCSKQATSLEEQTGKTEPTSSTRQTEQHIWEYAGCGPTFELKMQLGRSGTACDRLETTDLVTLSLIPEVAWQRPPEISREIFKLIITNDIATIATIQTAHTPELRR